jgi:dihydroflavonol-4-reductase
MIFVTGATGHIGNVLVRELLARGERVRVLVLPGEDRIPLMGLDVEQFVGDVLDAAALDKAMENVSLVYHLAGIISILPGHSTIVTRVNVEGTRNIVAAARRAKVKRLLYTSSIHAITRTEGMVIDESLPFDPCNCLGEYDRSKAQASLEVLQAVDKGLDAVIVCPTGIIGPFDYRLSEMGSLLLNTLRKRVQFCIDGAYDFVDVRDVVSGMILAAENAPCGERYILSGEQVPIARLLHLAQSAAGRFTSCLVVPFGLAKAAAFFTPWYYRLTRTRPMFTPYSLVTVMGNSLISSEKARRELGYQPRPLATTVADTMHWFMENRHVWAGG